MPYVYAALWQIISKAMDPMENPEAATETMAPPPAVHDPLPNDISDPQTQRPLRPGSAFTQSYHTYALPHNINPYTYPIQQPAIPPVTASYSHPPPYGQPYANMYMPNLQHSVPTHFTPNILLQPPALEHRMDTIVEADSAISHSKPRRVMHGPKATSSKEVTATVKKESNALRRPAGRQKGIQNFSKEDVMKLLQLVQNGLPTGSHAWDAVQTDYNHYAELESRNERSTDNLRQKFNKVSSTSCKITTISR